MQGQLGLVKFLFCEKFRLYGIVHVIVLSVIQKAVSMIHEAFDEDDQFRPHLG